MMIEELDSCPLCSSDKIEKLCEINRLYRCNNCSLVFDNPRPAMKEIIRFYSESGKYDSWIEKEKERAELWKRRLKRIRRHKQEGDLLDIGAGIGQFLSIAADNFWVQGTEVSASAIQMAKSRYGIDLHHGSLNEFVSDKKFDIITLIHLLEHLPDPGDALRLCRGLLKKDGMLVIAVPNELTGIKVWLKRFLTLLGVAGFRGRGKFGLPAISLTDKRCEIHLSHFTIPILSSYLQKEGFILLEKGLDPYYAAAGLQLFLHRFYYYLCRLIYKTSGIMLYDSIWIVARLGDKID